MDERIAIRALQPGDLPAYKAMRDAMLAAYPLAYTSDFETESVRPADSFRSRLDVDDIDGGHFTLGALLSEQLVGAISCERDPRAKVRHIGHITAMMVSPGWQRRGIGRALMRACVERARGATGLTLLTLSVTSTNEEARRLYLDSGFKPYGRLEGALRWDGRYHGKDYLCLWLTEHEP
jgi:ribosomal protein S18 acetylase RimI-like enzyme